MNYDELFSEIKDWPNSSTEISALFYNAVNEETFIRALIDAENYKASHTAYYVCDIDYTENIINLFAHKIEEGKSMIIPDQLKNNSLLFKKAIEISNFKLANEFENEILYDDFSSENFKNNNVNYKIKEIKKIYDADVANLFLEKINNSNDIMIPKVFRNDPYILKNIFKLGLYDCVDFFNEGAFNEENINLLIEKIKEKKINYVPKNLQNSIEFFNKMIDNDLISDNNIECFNNLKIENNTKICDIILKLLKLKKISIIPKFAISSHYFEKSYIKLLKKGKVNFIPHEWEKNPEIIRFALDHQPDFIEDVDFSCFDYDIIKKFVKEIKDDSYYKYLKITDTNRLLKDKKTLKILSKRLNNPNIEERIQFLYAKNNKIFENLSIGLLSSNFDSLDVNFLEKISSSPFVQDTLFDIRNFNPKFISVFANALNDFDNSNLDMCCFVERFFKGLKNKEFDLLLNSINVSELSLQELERLVFILQKGYNDFGIESIDDLDNLSLKRQEYFDNAYNSDNNDEIKNAILEKKYGINLERAWFIYDRYYEYLSNIMTIEELKNQGEIPFDIIDMFENIKIVLSCNDIVTLKNTLNSFNDVFDDSKIKQFVFSEEIIRSNYADMYNKSLYVPQDKDLTTNLLLSNVSYKGKQIPVYEVSDDFSMQVHVLGAYSIYEKPKNFKKEWDIPKIRMHGLCTSYIRSDEMSVAMTKHPVLGFSDFESSSLLLCANYDIVSSRYNDMYATSNGKSCQFLPPNLLIDNTRHSHNEMVLERRNLRENDPDFKRQPNYVVYFSDDVEKDEFSDGLWKETKQAAYDFGVPIVVVDRKRFLEKEKEKLSELSVKMTEGHDLDALDNFFTKYMNNLAGSRHSQHKNEFNDNTATECIEKIMQVIKNEIGANNNLYASSMIKRMIQILEREKRKYSFTRLAHPNFNKYIIELKSILEQLKQLENKELTSNKQISEEIDEQKDGFVR